MTSEPVQDQQAEKPVRTLAITGLKLLCDVCWIPENIRNYLSPRGRWYWAPVGFVGACSTAASSIVLMGAVITGRQDDPLELTIFLYFSAVIVMAGPMVLMAKIMDSLRA